MEKNNNIEEIYKKAFEDFEVTPSPKTWANIEKSFETKSPLQPYKWVLFSLAGIIVLLSVYFILIPNTSKLPLETASYSDKNQPVEQPSTTIIIDSADYNDTVSNEEENILLTTEQKSNIPYNSLEEEKTDIKNNIAQNNVETSIELSVEKKSTNDTEFQKIETPITVLNSSDVIPENTTIFDDTAIAEESEEATNTSERTSAQNINDNNDILMPNALSLSSIDYSELKPSNVCES